MKTLRFMPLGGLGEIGMNCLVLEVWDISARAQAHKTFHETLEEVIVIDCGLLFSELEHFGVEFVIPDFSYLKEHQDKISGIVITHGHEDHIGGLPFLFKNGIRAPVYASPFTSLLIQERLKEHPDVEEKVKLKTFKVGDSFSFKNFKIKTVSVNHSIVDCVALIIDTPIGKVIHTGDFKIDDTPFYGKKIDYAAFQKAGDEGVLLLMSDSTNVERDVHSLSEKVIYGKFEQLFKDAQGLTIVSMFASNVGRMGQVFQLANRLGKKVALSGRSMEQNVRLGMEAGYLKDAQNVLIAMDDAGNYPRSDVIILSTGSQAEYRSSLIRIANGEHSQIQIEDGDLVVMSSKMIPGNEKAIGRMINNLFKQGAEVLYESVHDIHVSGHATRPELKQMLEWTRPKFFMPVHGEYRHLVHHAALAEEVGVPEANILIATNGDWVGLTKDRLEIIDHFEEQRVLVESREGQDITKALLKDRRQLGEKGVVFAFMVRDENSRKVISGPDIVSRGLINPEKEAELLEEAKKVAQKVVAQYEKDLKKGSSEFDLEENVRIELRRYFNAQIGKKPMVLPVVVDL